MWADAARHYHLNPSWTAIAGYSMGGYATYKFATQYPDLFARAQPTVGPPGLGIWLPPNDPVPGGAASNTNRMLASVRNVPFLIWDGVLDELVPVAGAVAQAQTFDDLGYRYAFDLFAPPVDHLLLAANDEYAPAAKFLGTAKVDRNPPHVTYVVNPTMDFPNDGTVADHAYWLSGLKLRDGSGAAPLGQVDARSEGLRRRRRRGTRHQPHRRDADRRQHRAAHVRRAVEVVGQGAGGGEARHPSPDRDEPQRRHGQPEARTPQLRRSAARHDGRAAGRAPHRLRPRPAFQRAPLGPRPMPVTACRRSPGPLSAVCSLAPPMDSTFEATCQGIGLALAAGALGGALGRTDALGNVLAGIAAAAGAALFAVSLNGASHPAWPGLPAGAILAVLAYLVARDVVAGASKRSESGSAAAISGMVAVFAFALAALSLIVSPVALAALAGVIYLALARRSRSRRKYEGLRVLR